MLLKRIILVLISLTFGGLVTAGITLAVGTTPAEYGGAYFFFTALSLAVFAAIWLDKFMDTGLLPE